jgi:protein tyrosine phosphatase (PTP) superfamily phosphohydrolase (DUF442 family)
MPNRLTEIPNFLLISDRIATAGQPNAFQFGIIKAAGYDTIINLAMSNSTNALTDESAIAKSAWLEYLHIPVLWERPTLSDFDFFCKILDRKKSKKIFVHCAKNMRVSVFIYLWQRIHNHQSHTEAYPNLETIWTPNDTWQTFIQEVLTHHGILDHGIPQ